MIYTINSDVYYFGQLAAAAAAAASRRFSRSCSTCQAMIDPRSFFYTTILHTKIVKSKGSSQIVTTMIPTLESFYTTIITMVSNLAHAVIRTR